MKFAPFQGLVVWLWRILFGFPAKPQLPPAETKCNRAGCESRKDPRCQGGNCTFCCQDESGCNGLCLREQDLKLDALRVSIQRTDIDAKRGLLKSTCELVAAAGHVLVAEIAEYDSHKATVHCPRCSAKFNLKFGDHPVEAVIRALKKLPKDCDMEQVRQTMED